MHWPRGSYWTNYVGRFWIKLQSHNVIRLAKSGEDYHLGTVVCRESGLLVILPSVWMTSIIHPAHGKNMHGKPHVLYWSGCREIRTNAVEVLNVNMFMYCPVIYYGDMAIWCRGSDVQGTVIYCTEGKIIFDKWKIRVCIEWQKLLYRFNLGGR